MKCWIGIDPGMSGGIAAIYSDGSTWREPMPTMDGAVDGGEVAAYLLQIMALARTPGIDPDAYIVIERAQAMPKQGVTSMFKYGVGYGKILGAVETLGIPHETVQPMRWKAAVFAGTDWKGKGKEPSINFCRMQYPGVDLVLPRCRKPHDGMADALCLAHYGRTQRA